MKVISIFQDLLAELGNHIYPAFLLTLVMCMAFILATEDGLRDKLLTLWHTRKKVILFIFYLSFLLMATVFGRKTTNPTNSVFKHLFFKKGEEGWNKEIIENTLVFVPLTYLFLNSFSIEPSRPFKSSLCLAFGLSAFIELSQLVFWLGEFQFSDIIYNTLGGMLGYAAWRLIHGKISSRFRKNESGKENTASTENE